MKLVSAIAKAFSCWIDQVAAAVVPVLDRCRAPHVIRLVESANGDFAIDGDPKLVGIGARAEDIQMTEGPIAIDRFVQIANMLRGSRVELILQPSHFIFRQMDLPDRAGEFLEGIVRAQIDRLTPWKIAETAFGWRKSTEHQADHMVITVAATAILLLKPYVEAITRFSAHIVTVFAASPESETEHALIKVWQERTQDALNFGRIKKALTVGLAAVAMITLSAVVVSTIAEGYLDSRDQQVSGEILRVRNQINVRQATTSATTAGALRMLEQRKQNRLATVLVLDVLSQILPDQTYITELRIEDQKIRMIGFTNDAPALIGLIEQSGRFTGATFFAPTTREPSAPSERFHIEAVIRPAAES